MLHFGNGVLIAIVRVTACNITCAEKKTKFSDIL